MYGYIKGTIIENSSNYILIDNNGIGYIIFVANPYSYEINNPAYIPVPHTTNDYLNKYYNINGDQMWYHDAAFTQLWVECPSHNV